MNINQKTLDRLEFLEQLYRQGYQSEVVDRSLEKILRLEQTAAQNDLANLQERLKAYETRYHMSSTEFQRRFQMGELGDEIDFMDWSVFFEMRAAVQKRLDDLQNKLA